MMSKINQYRQKYEDYLGYKIGHEFDVHHIDSDHHNNSNENMVFLPRKFHEDYHATKSRLIDLCFVFGFDLGQLPTLSIDESFNVEDYKSGSYLQWFKGHPAEYEAMCYRNIRIGWLFKRGLTLIESLSNYDRIILETKKLQDATRDIERSNEIKSIRKFLAAKRATKRMTDIMKQAKKNAKAFTHSMR